MGARFLGVWLISSKAQAQHSFFIQSTKPLISLAVKLVARKPHMLVPMEFWGNSTYFDSLHTYPSLPRSKTLGPKLKPKTRSVSPQNSEERGPGALEKALSDLCYEAGLGFGV